MTTIGHNSAASLDAAADANMQTGILLLCKEALISAIQDRRLDRGHLRVLAAVASFMGLRGRAWPGRLQIALMTDMDVRRISNVLLELKTWGYLIAEKEIVPEAGDKRLTVYTFGKVDHTTIRKSVADFMARVGGGSQKVTPQRDVEITPQRDFSTESHALAGLSPEKSRPSVMSKVTPQRDVGVKSHAPARLLPEKSRQGVDSITSKNGKDSREVERSPLSPGSGDFQIGNLDVWVPEAMIEKWRTRFTAIDLDAQMQKLGAWISNSAHSHPARSQPAAWMVGILSEKNQEAIAKAQITQAKIEAARSRGARPGPSQSQGDEMIKRYEQAKREEEERAKRR